MKQKYIDIYNSCKEEFRVSDSDFRYQQREKALAEFQRIGLPDAQTETYRNLNVNNIFANNYSNVFQQKTKVDLNEYFKCEVENMDADVVLFSNGIFYHDNAIIDKNIVVCSLQEAQIKHKSLFEQYFNTSTSGYNDGFVHLTNMLASDGIFVYVPDNVRYDKTLQIINLTHGFGNKNIIKRNLIVLGKNAGLSVVICDHTLNTSDNFVIDTTESFVGENSQLTHYTIQNQPDKSSSVNTHFADIEANANVESFVLSLHGGIIRNNLRVRMKGEHAECNLLGLHLTDRQQYVDNYTLIEHLVPNCTSNELYKGILDEQARGSFMGKIIVCEGAQKTAAFQTNRNLCLTGEARMTTKPQLEIYADDVQCSHGATVGQLDESALFYLRQRGISTKEAKLMLMFAFANDILMNIHIEPLKERISGLINSRLRGELSDCSNCLMNCNGK